MIPVQQADGSISVYFCLAQAVGGKPYNPEFSVGPGLKTWTMLLSEDFHT